MYLRCTDYETKWDEIADVFSKDAVLKGSFDKYAETNKAKRGTAEVDDAFLHEIEEWRTALAANIALRNADLSQRELNFAVQRTIDRIIFLRICEDRGIETYGALMSLQNSERIYKRLIETFHRADERYNSGLFHFRPEKERNEPPDEMTLGLDIDDKPLKEIIKSLYYPQSPYEFSVLPADILGQVYEQFLGKVIRLTAGHRAVVEDKPEVKKAGGVYYTPTYIVEYIVKNTVGRLLGSDPTLSPTDLTPALSKGEGVLREAPNPRFMTTDAGTWNYLKPLAQENRQQPTEAEEKLWQRLRNRQLGFKFRRQHAIDQFVVDFVCIEKNLMVEVDGESHADQQEYDAERSRMLNTRGFQVIRFWNHEVINNIGDVLARIRQALDLTGTPSPNWRGVSEGRGEVRKQMTPKQVAKLRILDPACGSGSFLIGAYQYLLDWHRDWYMKDGPEKWAKGKNPAL
jgi:very-short-patch-repair endonuclease